MKIQNNKHHILINRCPISITWEKENTMNETRKTNFEEIFNEVLHGGMSLNWKKKISGRSRRISV